jgi:GNAT superfamily N-acetyltransferase
MTERTPEWTVQASAPDGDALAALSADRLWSGYALATMDPRVRRSTDIGIARRASGDLAVCTVHQPGAFASLVSFGDEAGLAAILATMPLPQQAIAHVPPAHRVTLQRSFAAPHGLQDMVRMAVTGAAFQRPHAPVSATRLSLADLDGLVELYGEDERGFISHLLAGGPFYGIREEHKLLAAAGTHVASSYYGIGAVGAVLTRPEARGHGYAGVVTAAVVAELLAAGCRDVILNVAADNASAQSVYKRLGFHVHCAFCGGVVQRQ